MSEYVIRIEGVAGMPERREYNSQYIRDFTDTPDGDGNLSITVVPSLAKRFSTLEGATEFYRQQSKYVPLRPDGKPNRPLTAFTVSVLRAETDGLERISGHKRST